MKLLSRSEEVILLTILKLNENAYGVSIREQIYIDTGDMWSFASIYQPLDKLTRKQFVIKVKGEPSPERGGKRKYLYRVTPAGKQALRDIRRAHDNVWAGIPEIALD